MKTIPYEYKQTQDKIRASMHHTNLLALACSGSTAFTHCPCLGDFVAAGAFEVVTSAVEAVVVSALALASAGASASVATASSFLVPVTVLGSAAGASSGTGSGFGASVFCCDSGVAFGGGYKAVCT